MKHWLVAAILVSLCVGAGAQTKAKSAKTKKTGVQQDEVLLAEQAIAKNDLATAEQLLNRAKAKNANDYRVWYTLGYVYRATNRVTEAQAAYDRTLVLRPDLAEGYYEVGVLLLSQKQNDLAASQLRKAAELRPDAKTWLALGEALSPSAPAEAVAAFRKAAELDPHNADPLLHLGDLLAKQNSFPEAMAAYEQALARAPSAQRALFALAQIALQQKQFAEAERHLRTLVDLSTEHAHKVQLARVLMAQNRANEAAVLLDAVRPALTDPAALRDVAAVYAAAGRPQNALAIYGDLLKSDSQDVDLRFDYARLLFDQRDFAAAEKAFVEALTLDPKRVEGYASLAAAANENKNYPLVIRALDARAKYAPETTATYFLRATSFDHLRLYKEAAKNYYAFLDAAGGKLPDQEWQARHRLIAIDPDAEKKAQQKK